MHSKGARYVSVCYVLEGKRKCEILPRIEAYALRRFIESREGTIYWFNPIYEQH